MKNSAKRLLAFLLVALLCVSMAVPAFASEPAQQNADPNSNLDSVYADVDFDVATGTMTDKYDKLDLTVLGSPTITETEVTFNGTTAKIPTFNASNKNVGKATFKEFTSPEVAMQFWNDEDGFSLEAFYIARGNRSAVEGVFCATDNGTAGRTGVGIAIQTSGAPYLCLGLASNSYLSITSNTTVPVTDWAHVITTTTVASGTLTAKVYLNGAEVASSTSASTIKTTDVNKTLIIGGDTNPNAANVDFPNDNFSIADLKVYSKALTPNDVTARYNAVMTDLEAYSIESMEVTIGDSISAYFTAKGNNTTKLDTAQMRFTFNGDEKTVDLNGSEYERHAFFEGIAPNTLGDTIKAELLVNGAVVDTVETSVMDYLNQLKTMTAADLNMTPTQHAKLMTLVDDLIVYGGAAQTYTNYKTDELVSTGVTGTTFQNLPAPVGIGKKDGAKLIFTTANLWFDNVNKLMFNFSADPVNVPGLTFKIKVNDGPEEIVNPANIVQNGTGGSYTLYTDAIRATGFDDVYTLTVYNNSDNSVEAKVTYSVAAYVYAKQGGGGAPAFAALAKATYNYGLAAKAFREAMMTPATVVYYTMGETPVAVNAATNENLGELAAVDGVTLTSGHFYLVDPAISTLTACVDLGTAVANTDVSLGLTVKRSASHPTKPGEAIATSSTWLKGIGKRKYNTSTFMNGAAINNAIANYNATGSFGTLTVVSATENEITFETSTGLTLTASAMNAKFAYFTYDGSEIKIATNATPTTPITSHGDILRYAADTALGQTSGYTAAAWQGFVDNYGAPGSTTQCDCDVCQGGKTLQDHWMNVWLNCQIPANYASALANYNKVASTNKPALLQAMNDAQTAFDTALSQNATISALKQAADTAGEDSDEETAYIDAVEGDAVLAPLYTALTTATSLYNNYDAYVARYQTMAPLYTAFCNAHDTAANAILWDKANVGGSALYTWLQADGAKMPTFSYFYDIETDAYTIYVTSAKDSSTRASW